MMRMVAVVIRMNTMKAISEDADDGALDNDNGVDLAPSQPRCLVAEGGRPRVETMVLPLLEVQLQKVRAFRL